MDTQQPNPKTAEPKDDNLIAAEVPKGASHRRRRIWTILLLVGLLAGGISFVAYRQTSVNSDPENASAKADSKDVYYCPMHKDYKSDKPGSCPICSMKLVKQKNSSSGPGSKQMGNMPGMKMNGDAKSHAGGKKQDMPGMPGMKMDAAAGGAGENTI